MRPSNMRESGRRFLALVPVLGAAAALLAGCASAPPQGPARLGLRLAPSALGAAIAIQQHLTVERDGKTNDLDVALEVDADHVGVVGLAFGQRVLALRFDAAGLTEWRHPMLPAQVRGADVLEDLQLTLWPADAIRLALPPGWQIDDRGQERTLRLELKLLADVGLLGFPNAGKSTLIRAVSAATPKVADYPFTTLYPNLGVVSVEPYRSFVIADIPGLIEGAADGAGLGAQFLRHLQRTRLLLHLVDIAPMEGGVEGVTPAEQVRAIERELGKHDPELLAKPRWLVLNKADLLLEEEQAEVARAVIEELGWTDRWYLVSAIGREGTWPVMKDIMAFFDRQREDALEEARNAPDAAPQQDADGA